MSECCFYQVDITDSESGNSRHYFSDLATVKELPVVFKNNNCLPEKIRVKTFAFDSATYKSQTDMICAALNRQPSEIPKKLITWSTAKGWVEE